MSLRFYCSKQPAVLAGAHAYLGGNLRDPPSPVDRSYRGGVALRFRRISISVHTRACLRSGCLKRRVLGRRTAITAKIARFPIARIENGQQTVDARSLARSLPSPVYRGERERERERKRGGRDSIILKVNILERSVIRASDASRPAPDSRNDTVRCASYVNFKARTSPGKRKIYACPAGQGLVSSSCV